MAPPPFSDISKNANGLIGRDFYHLSTAALEVKSKAPNGVAFAFKGKTGKDNSLSSSIEAKYTDKATGVTLTQGWNTANLLDTKIELVDTFSPGLKAEVLTQVGGPKPNVRVNAFFSQPLVNVRGFFNLAKSAPTFNGDVSVGKDGYVAGGEVGYDIGGGKVTKFSLSSGYIHPVYAVGVHSTKDFSIYSASYFHKVSPLVEAGAKAVYDSKSSGTKPVSIEFATKYSFDSSSFVKAKIADSGLAALSYSQQLRPGVTLGVGLGFDATKLSEPVHKFGYSLTFSA